MKNRINGFIAAVLDEVISEAKGGEYKAKKEDYVRVIRGALTGECGDITYVIPGGTMADIKTATGKIARVAVKHLQKEKKEK